MSVNYFHLVVNDYARQCLISSIVGFAVNENLGVSETNVPAVELIAVRMMLCTSFRLSTASTLLAWLFVTIYPIVSSVCFVFDLETEGSV